MLADDYEQPTLTEAPTEWGLVKAAEPKCRCGLAKNSCEGCSRAFHKDESGWAGYVAYLTVFGALVMAVGHLIGVICGWIK